MKTLVTLFLVLVVSTTHAHVYYQDTGWKLQPDGNGVYSVLPDDRAGGATTTGCTTIACSRGGSMGGPLGKPRPTMTPSANFPKPNIASAALGLGARLLPWVAVGQGLYDWYNAAGLVPDPADGFPAQSSGGQVPAPSTVFRPEGNPYIAAAGWFTTRDAALNAGSLRFAETISEVIGSGTVMTSYVPSRWQNGDTVPGTVYWTRWGSPGQTMINVGLVARNDTQTQCAYQSTGQLSGIAATGGLCPSGTLTRLTPQQAQQALQDAPITSDVLRRSFDDILDAGGGIASTGTQVTGPSSAPGETTTRTRTAANGTTQVSTTTTNYNYTYNDNRVTVTETKTTQNPDGSTETETTDQPTDDCARNPEALKCKELGQETGSPTWETKTVLFQAENLGLSGSCPAPWVANLRGWNLTMSYQPVCDVAPTVRLGLLAVTALMCIFVVIRVTQS